MEIILKLTLITWIVFLFHSVTAPSSMAATLTYQYDELGRLARVTHENSGYVEFQHDPVGNRDSVGIIIDSDQDGLLDDSDNCTLVANPDQRDTDMDGLGNICDGDFNNDCVVNFPFYRS